MFFSALLPITTAAAVCAILVLIFAGARAADYLPETAEGMLLLNTVLRLILLNLLLRRVV